MLRPAFVGESRILLPALNPEFGLLLGALNPESRILLPVRYNPGRLLLISLRNTAMKCPKCGEPLKARSFQKIEIDQCTGCSGIWLDAGELESVAEKEVGSWLGKFWQKNG